jgi:hypothetical protein
VTLDIVLYSKLIFKMGVKMLVSRGDTVLEFVLIYSLSLSFFFFNSAMLYSLSTYSVPSTILGIEYGKIKVTKFPVLLDSSEECQFT